MAEVARRRLLDYYNLDIIIAVGYRVKSAVANPENPGGYKTAYLWEDVLERHGFLDILARFIHLQIGEKKLGGKKVKKETMIFPRYHQLSCVRNIVADARERIRGNQLPRPALGRERQVELPPAKD